MRPNFLLLVLTAACAPRTETGNAASQGGEDVAAVRRAIEASNAHFMEHFNQGHGEVAASGYTEDGRLMVVNAPVALGKQAIAAAISGLGTMKANVVITIDTVYAHGPLAVERGTYQLTMTPPGATAPVSERGTYLVHWQKVGDQWLRVNDMVTSDKPLPPPPSQ